MKIRLDKILFDTGIRIGQSDYHLDVEENDIKIAFGQSLKHLRQHKGYTLVQLEKELDIPNPSLSRYENGQNSPSIIQALKIAQFFGTDINAMIFCGLVDDSGTMILEWESPYFTSDSEKEYSNNNRNLLFKHATIIEDSPPKK